MTQDEFVESLLSHEDFLKRLDPSNKYYSALRRNIGNAPSEYVFAVKNRHLIGMVEEMRGAGVCPIIDKKLSVVIGCISHRNVRANFYRYHMNMADRAFSSEEYDKQADAYTFDGFGYHFSSMMEFAPLFGQKVRPIVGSAYQPDRLDRDLFRFYGVMP